MARLEPAEFRKRLNRTNELPLIYAVLLFQLVAMGLLAFRDGAAEAFSLKMAVLLPLGTYVGLKLMTWLWPVDRAIYIMVAFLCSLSVVLLRAVFTREKNAADQATYLLVGYGALLFGAAFIRSLRSWDKFSLICMPLCLAFLITPFFFTNSTAKNWIRLGGVQLQPSELMKPAMAVILAAGFSGRRGWRSWLLYGAFAAAACAILLVERDLGAVMLYFVLTICMFYAGTGKGKATLAVVLAATGGLALILGNIDWIASRLPVFKYAADRIAIWKNPWNSTYENARQIMQGLISIASGGLFGSGLGLGSAHRVAVVASDYIFAALCEEMGLVFALAVLAVYLCLFLRSITIAMNARQRFHALVVFGCAVEITAQMLLIVCGNVHLLPLTGVTLPFISEGGSSLTACMAQMGMILGVSAINAQDEYDDLCRLNGGTWRDAE